MVQLGQRRGQKVYIQVSSRYFMHGLQQFTLYNSLMFPRWDVISVIFSVFLLTYTYQEGKSNYFKGSILCLSYVVLVAGFYYIPSFSNASNLYVGIEPRV